MEKEMQETLARLRRKFGIEQPSTGENIEKGKSLIQVSEKRQHKSVEGMWTGDSHGDSLHELETRHGIDRRRYHESSWYRRQVDADIPAYGIATKKETQNNGDGES